MIGSVPPEASPLLFSLLIPACILATPPAPTRTGNVFGPSFRTLVALLLPPSLYFLLGQAIADWPLAHTRSTEESVTVALSLSLGAIVLVRSAGAHFRIQPVLAGVSALASVLLPLGVALERFLMALPLPWEDTGHLGMISALSAIFALTVHLIRNGTTPPSPSGEAIAPWATSWGGMILAWMMAALSVSPNPTAVAATLLVAVGTSMVASTTASIALTGVIPPRGALVSMLAGLLAAIPAASSLDPRGGALAGLFGAAAGQLALRAIRTFSSSDDLIVPAHLGGGLAGLIVSGFIQRGDSFSAGAFAILGMTIATSAATALLAGCAFWKIASLCARLHTDPEELDVGLDLVEHGCHGDDAPLGSGGDGK